MDGTWTWRVRVIATHDGAKLPEGRVHWQGGHGKRVVRSPFCVPSSASIVQVLDRTPRAFARADLLDTFTGGRNVHGKGGGDARRGRW